MFFFSNPYIGHKMSTKKSTIFHVFQHFSLSFCHQTLSFRKLAQKHQSALSPLSSQTFFYSMPIQTHLLPAKESDNGWLVQVASCDLDVDINALTFLWGKQFQENLGTRFEGGITTLSRIYLL